MTDYTEFFLASRRDVAQLEMFEVTHPNFTKPYRIVRNAPKGVTVNLSNEEPNVTFDYYPAIITPSGSKDDLDASVKVQLGDLGEVIPFEIDAVEAAGGFLTKPQLRYWAFRSDVLAAPIYGPLLLEVPSVTHDGVSSTLEASAPRLNVTGTGERYDLTRFPMLRGFS